MPKRALVMSGGGSRGAFQLGAVDYLVNDRGLDFEVIAGVSTGSLNAVMLAQGRGLEGLREQLEELKRVWFGIRSSRDVYRRRFLGELLVFVLKNSLYSTRPLRKKIWRLVSPAKLQSSGKELRIGAVCLESGDFRAADQNDLLIREWTLASASIPVLFPVVGAGDQSCVDGGARDITPLNAAFEALKQVCSDVSEERAEMYVLLASPLVVSEQRSRWKTGLDVAERASAILLNEISREDVKHAIAVNRSVRAYREIQKKLEELTGLSVAAQSLDRFVYRPPKYQDVRILGIVPDEEFSDALEFDPAKIRRAFEAGRRAAAAPLSEERLAEKLAKTEPRK